MSNAVLPVYGPSPVVFERGEGVRMYDDKGKPYLDFIAGIAVNALGHCHPALVKALSDPTPSDPPIRPAPTTVARRAEISLIRAGRRADREPARGRRGAALRGAASW